MKDKSSKLDCRQSLRLWLTRYVKKQYRVFCQLFCVKSICCRKAWSHPHLSFFSKAGIFGCLVGLKDSVTAITFVALGTSLPDTFASRAAAIGEKHADNAIGNVTGSNSVNVFLGLGLPWLIAAIYHAAKVRASIWSNQRTYYHPRVVKGGHRSNQRTFNLLLLPYPPRVVKAGHNQSYA